MPKFVGVGLTILIMLTALPTTEQRFLKYRKIEAYEVRPGILMMPRYTADDKVCEIGLERLHYSPDLVRLGSDISSKDIDEILDELVPADERGKPGKELDNLITQVGQGFTQNIEFENVTLQIYGAASPSDRKGETTVNQVAATIKWKQRVCR